ncbi:MAG: BamA/TamA family outer membrane protein [Candidatus Latescibacteria bacterium]|nr:BamA/TamA family outer membrane protein [Candidatus Latescibacterota bacterium]
MAALPAQPPGWQPTALPLLNFSSDDGAGYGLQVSLYQYDGASLPYASALSAQLFATTRGRWAHRLYLDLPRWRPAERLEMEFRYEKQDYANYYADLDDTAAEALLAGAPVGERRQRSTFRQTYPRLTVMWLRALNQPWQLRAGLQAGYCRVRPNAGPGNLLFDLAPVGRDGGWLVLVNVALRRDTRDDYNDPSGGTLAELLLEYGGSPEGVRGGRLNAEHRRFLPLPGGLVLAQRAAITLAIGDLPFFELPALGGDNSVRGLLEARERGEGRLLGNLELRWPGWSPVPSLPVRGGLLIFADAGQIFPRRRGPSLGGWRTGTGLGARGHWHSTIVRADLGRSEGRTGVYLKFSQVF